MRGNVLKLKIYIIMATIIFTGLLVSACSQPAADGPQPGPVPMPPVNEYTESESRQIALEFLTNSPTYLFDGIIESIKHKETLDAFCPSCWGFVFEFQSAHAGYGDRTGQILAQVITTHEAIISVNQGNVDGGTIDGIWDMVAQQEITPPKIQTAEYEE